MEKPLSPVTTYDFDLIELQYIYLRSLLPTQPSVFHFPPIPRVPSIPSSSHALPFSETPECGAYQYQRSGRCCQGIFFFEAVHKVVGT